MFKKHPLSALLISVFAVSACTSAFADGDNHNESNDSVNEHTSNESDVDHVAAMVGGGNTSVTRTQDGHYEIQLSNGGVVAVTPQGNTRVHTLATGVNTTSVDADGHLHVQTSDGYEMTVNSAPHSETETRNVMAQNGLSNVTSNGGRVSATHTDGTQLSLEADYDVSRNTAAGVTQYRESSTGVDIDYADGTHQHFHGAAADVNQLRNSAQSLGYSVTFNSDGSIDARSNGASNRVKLSPTLTRGYTAQPGLRIQNNKVVMQYQNGLEQEVIVLQ